MSEGHSNFDKDPSKKHKKKPEGGQTNYKQPQKKGGKDYQVQFEPKGNENPQKDHPPSTKPNPPHSKHEEYPTKGQKQENYQSYKSKNYKSDKKTSRDQAISPWKRKHPKIPKSFILKIYQQAPTNKEIDSLVSASNLLFVKEKQIPVNEENFELDPNEGLILRSNFVSTASSSTATSTTTTTQPTPTGSKTTPVVANTTSTVNNTTPASTTSTTSTGNTGKPLEMFDFAQERPDPIQGNNSLLILRVKF